MLSSSVTVRRLTDNQVLSLADILQAGLQHYCDHISPMESAYVKRIRLLAGLGFTTSLVDLDLISITEPRLKKFIEHQHFKESSNHIYHFSHSAARLIQEGIYISSITHSHPPYQSIWVDTLRAFFKDIVIDITHKRDKAAELERALFDQTSFL